MQERNAPPSLLLPVLPLSYLSPFSVPPFSPSTPSRVRLFRVVPASAVSLFSSFWLVLLCTVALLHARV